MQILPHLTSKASYVGVAAQEDCEDCSDDRVAVFVPMWQQIRDDILAQIKAGLLKPGDKLPSTRELSERYEVASATTRKAVDILIATGVLVGHQGRGVYVAPEPADGS